MRKTGFGVQCSQVNTLSLWERVRVRAKRTAAALLSSAGQPWPQPSPQGRGGRSRGFTLTELLIVIAILILLLSVAVPAVSRLLNAGREDSAFAALGAAIATARSYTGRNPVLDYGPFQGTALIVTPANELRIVQHVPDDAVSSQFTDDPHLNVDRGGYRLLGYADIGGEGYIRLPKGVGLVGISRHTSAQPHLLAPPFALRFDNNGHLRVDASHGVPSNYARNAAGQGHIFYDGNYDGDWGGGPRGEWPEAGDHPRDDGYNPRFWDPEFAGKTPGDSGDADPHDNPRAIYHRDQQKFMLPFDALETVIGVIAFDKQTLYSQFGPNALQSQDTDNTPPAEHGNLRPEVRQWLFENGKVMFFNRYSGAVIKP